MEKEILFLSLLTLVYLYDFKILNQDPNYPCTIRNIFGKVKLSIERNYYISDLIPFELNLKNEISGKIVNVSCYIEKNDWYHYQKSAYCYILSDILDDLNNYNISSIKSEYDIEISDNFKFNAYNKDEYSSYNMSLFYRQVNNFQLGSKKGTFMFYGLKKYTIFNFFYFTKITFIIKLHYDNYSEIREAICYRIKTDDFPSDIQQNSYKCEITEIKNNLKYLRILDSDDVSGIPYDYNNKFRDPLETQKEINNGTLVNSANSKTFSLFKLNNAFCDNKRDIITFSGTTFGEIKESKVFPIFLSSSNKCRSECYVPAATSEEKIQIKCTLCSTALQKSNFIFENQILKNGKDEILFLNEDKIEKCTAFDNNSILYFRQINSFSHKKNKKKMNFNFIGLTTEPIYNEIKLYLYLIKGNKLESNLNTALCSFNNQIKIKNLFQNNYSCEIQINNNDYSSFELSRYNNINIEDIPEDKALLNPLKTDKAIKDKIIGNFKENIFNSSFIITKNCHNINEFRITGIFNGVLDKTINFTMKTFPLEYILDCTLYKNLEEEAEIHCVVHDKIYLSDLIIEQQIIRDGLKELFIISKINSANKKCIEFIKTNNFNIETSFPQSEESKNGGESSSEYSEGESSSEYSGGESSSEHSGGENSTEYSGGENSTEYIGGENSTEYIGGESSSVKNMNGTVLPPFPGIPPNTNNSTENKTYEFTIDTLNNTIDKINESNTNQPENDTYNSELKNELNGTNSKYNQSTGDKNESIDGTTLQTIGSIPQSSGSTAQSSGSTSQSSGSTPQESESTHQESESIPAPPSPESKPSYPESVLPNPESSLQYPESVSPYPESAPSSPESKPPYPESAPLYPESSPQYPESVSPHPESKPHELDSTPNNNQPSTIVSNLNNNNIVTSISHGEESPNEDSKEDERPTKSGEESSDNNNPNRTISSSNPDTTNKITESNTIHTENINSELKIELNQNHQINNLVYHLKNQVHQIKNQAHHLMNQVIHLKNQEHHIKKQDHHIKNQDRHHKNQDHHIKNQNHHIKNQDRHLKNQVHQIKNQDHHIKNQDHYLKNLFHQIKN